MMIDKINQTTEVMLSYYKKLVELEGAVISFNTDLVSAKTNDIHVLRIQIEKTTNDLAKTFKSETGLEWSVKNFKTYCSGSIKLSIAYNNLYEYTKACQHLAKEVLICNEEAMEIATKTLGTNDRRSGSLPAGKGKWSKKAKR